MARFRVPEELESGVYREGVGRFGVGQELSLPDAASPRDEHGAPLPGRPHYLLEPLDAEADAVLQAAYKGTPKAKKLKRFAGKPKASKTADEADTPVSK